jgi:large subunit ribosomal protein L13
LANPKILSIFAPQFSGPGLKRLKKQVDRMNTLSYKTVSANKNTVTKEWVLIDAENQTLGRLASEAAKLLRGKHKTNYTPHVDCGDNVVIINAEKIRLTGNKWDAKEYIRHSGYPGGQRSTTARELMNKKPEAMVEKAIKGMLPKNKLGSQLFRNLYVYVGSEHNQEAQKPKKINLNTIR